MDIKRTNPKVFAEIADRLKSLDGKTAKAGWFETSRYEGQDAIPVAYIASSHEYGAVIQHPGGTPYKIGADGRAVFVTKAAGAGLPVTKPHTIVIPPRPFMRPTMDRMKDKWLALMQSGAKAVVAGTTTAYNVLDALGLNAQEEIKRSITLVLSPPLKPATIRARMKAKADKKTRGLLDKPLEDTFTMYDSVQHVVDNSDE